RRGSQICTASSQKCCRPPCSGSSWPPRRRKGAPMPAPPPETSVVEHELRVAARPETVFAYFTDPAKMVQWMGAEATLDPRPGGICRIAFQASQARVESLGAELLGERQQAPEPIELEPTGVMSG